jgi:hypothetical protein
MSSSKTPLIGLNQWDATDPVLRVDFNSDNQKIDTAFGNLAMMKLADITTTVNRGQIDIDLGGPLDRFAELEIYLADFHLASGAHLTSAYGHVRLGGLMGTYYENNSSSTTNYLTQFVIPCNYDKAAGCYIRILPAIGAYSPRKLVRATSDWWYSGYYDSFSQSSHAGTYQGSELGGISTINIINTSTSYQFRPGMRVVVYGKRL